ncbi:MAG: methylmalonyl-CoA mutase small subunit [Dysgonamonadaceae bacterium]|jgi:methylmalonyl-CoA mutase|nr:methylmalonyl-CoA mutase small subunit [Dysgonamonadaceae bacterium]
MSNSKEKLFSEFPPVSTEKWMEKIITDLKGADFEKKLVWKTNEGFAVKPFYREEDIAELKTANSLPGEFPYVRGTKKNNNDWFVRQDIEVKNFSEANKKALDILNKGITSLGFKINRQDVSKENIAVLLNGIHAEAVELNFSTCQMKSVELISILVDYFKEKKYDPTKIFGSVNIDFVGATLRKGIVKEEWVNQMVAAIKAAAELRYFKVIAVNAYLFNNAGSYITQELAYALAWGNELMSQLVDAGVNPTFAAKKIKFNFGIGANYFMEIAKFRAARWLWAEIVKAYEPKCDHDCPNEGPTNECRCAGKMNIFAQTSTFNQTLFDAHVNMLRTQTEAMSAAIAGVDSMLVSPFDESFRTPDEFSERIARNQQLLLKEECHFDKIADPSGGSYYIETLTNSIAQEAWNLFLKTEEKGFYKSVQSGEIQVAVNASAEKRFKALSQRREILLGTNQFPNFTEVASGKIGKDNPCHSDCSDGQKETTITTLNTKRLANEFESLRLTTEQSGKEVKAFMLTIGNLAMRLARSQFSSNFLACAGYKPIDNLGFETVDTGIEAARKAGADIIVLCSSDDEYAEYAPQAYELTKGKEILIVAGAPASMEELKALGIEYFINVRSNVLETLQSLNAKLGIQ